MVTEVQFFGSLTPEPILYIFLANQITGFSDQLQVLDMWMKTLYFLHDVIECRKEHSDGRKTVWPENSTAFSNKILGLLITSTPESVYGFGSVCNAVSFLLAGILV